MARRLRRERVERGERFWRRAVGRWRRSGLSAAAFCRREDLPPSSFSYWQRKLSTESPEESEGSANLVPVEVVASSSLALEGTVFEVLLRSGHVLRVPAGFDVESLRALVAVLEDRRC